jgi:hypothetical protein
MDNLLFLKPIPTNGKIRIGPKHDGGYVLYEKSVRKTDVLLSYGVGFDVDFEREFNSITKSKVLMFDPTLFGKYLFDFKHFFSLLTKCKLIEAIKYPSFIFYCWVLKIQMKKKDIHFYNEGISVEKKGNYDTFKNQLLKHNLDNKSILIKMDIEGNEYDILLNNEFHEHLDQVTQIAIEFHDLKNRLRTVEQIMNKFSSRFDLVHIHGNNFGAPFKLYRDNKKDLSFPDTIEVTLIKKGEVEKEKIIPNVEYPVSLVDFPNNPRNRDYTLVFE